jgi:hypothetical protein
MEWKMTLDARSVRSYSEIASEENLTRARVTQIMNLLKLPLEWRIFLAGLDDPKEIRKYSERRLRNYRSSGLPHKPPQISKKQVPKPEETSSRKIRTKRKWVPDVTAVEVDEEISPLNLEALIKLIQKATFRKLKELEKDT